MISKHYSIFCNNCTKTEGLMSHTLKECEQEARRMGWKKKNGEWICEECADEKEQQ